MITYWKEKILSQEEKRVSFYEYMSDCLYHPEYGYYMRFDHKIGKQGDFYTSSSVHSVFAETILEIVEDICRKNNLPIHFCEMGAGTGRFASQFLDALKNKYPQEYQQARYILIEKSNFHRRQQEMELKDHQEHVLWLDSVEPKDSFSGIFFSNELVDAFPVYLVEKKDNQLLEVGVTWNDKEKVLEEIMYPLKNQEVHHYLQRFDLDLVEGQRLEVPLDAAQWVKEVGEWVKEGVWITIDYGYTNEQLMMPPHRRGSLLCYDDHQRDDHPYLKPGQKDMTYHVHFDVLRDVAFNQGWEYLGFYNQADFLLRAGILSMLEEHQDTDPFQQGALKRNRAIRQFISPEGISGSFQVLVLGKGKFTHPETNYTFTKPFSIHSMLP